MVLDRRTFLARAALSGGALALPGVGLTLASACGPAVNRRTDHYFVFYFMLGGWDLMLHTDPVDKRPGLYVPYDDDETFEVGGHRFGPDMQALKAHMGSMGILRGVYCDALNHPQARVRMCTGKFRPPGAGATPGVPSVQALLAQRLGDVYEIANLSTDTMRPASFRGNAMPELYEPLRVGSVGQLQTLLSWHGFDGKLRTEVQRALAEKDRMFAASSGGASPLPQQFDTHADLARHVLDSPSATQLRNTLLNTDVVKNSKNAKLAVQAVKYDLAPVITVGTGEFDAHTKSQYAGHRSAVALGMKTVAEICAGLQAEAMPGGKTLLDHTTVVVTSEFSREPFKNELGGKHHWPANSMLFIGKGVRKTRGGVTVFGECDGGVNPVKMNPQNGSLKRGVEDLEMGHGLATVLAMAGLDPVALIEKDPIPALMGPT